MKKKLVLILFLSLILMPFRTLAQEVELTNEDKFEVNILDEDSFAITSYDDNNKVLKTRIMDLITEMEILLGVPITFPSKIPECVNKIIEESFKKRGGVSRGR